MATTSTTTAVVTVEPVFTEPERLALAGFLAGYTGRDWRPRCTSSSGVLWLLARGW